MVVLHNFLWAYPHKPIQYKLNIAKKTLAKIMGWNKTQSLEPQVKKIWCLSVSTPCWGSLDDHSPLLWLTVSEHRNAIFHQQRNVHVWVCMCAQALTLTPLDLKYSRLLIVNWIYKIRDLARSVLLHNSQSKNPFLWMSPFIFLGCLWKRKHWLELLLLILKIICIANL